MSGQLFDVVPCFQAVNEARLVLKAGEARFDSSLQYLRGCQSLGNAADRRVVSSRLFLPVNLVKPVGRHLGLDGPRVGFRRGAQI